MHRKHIFNSLPFLCAAAVLALWTTLGFQAPHDLGSSRSSFPYRRVWQRQRERLQQGLFSRRSAREQLRGLVWGAETAAARAAVAAAAAAASAAEDAKAGPVQWGEWRSAAVGQEEEFCERLHAARGPNEPPLLLVDVSGVLSSGPSLSHDHNGDPFPQPRSLLRLLGPLQPRVWLDGYTRLAYSQPYSLYVHGSYDIVSSLLAEQGSWEPDVVRVLVAHLHAFARERRLPKEGVLLVDVGANIGALSLAVAAHGFSVLAFEPMPANILALRHSLCANEPELRRRVALVPKGLGNATQRCSIYSHRNNVGDGVVSCAEGGRAAWLNERDYFKRGELHMVRLDDYAGRAGMEDFRRRVGAVKIDVEGNELAVVEGAMEFLKATRPPLVMAECSDKMMLGATGRPAAFFLQQMASLGYRAHNGSLYEKAIPEAAMPSWKEPGVTNYWFDLPSEMEGPVGGGSVF